jgi:hypothetical protein
MGLHGLLQGELYLFTFMKFIQCVKLAELCERTLRNGRRNASESFVKKLNRVRGRNENIWQRRQTDNIEERGEP